MRNNYLRFRCSNCALWCPQISGRQQQVVLWWQERTNIKWQWGTSLCWSTSLFWGFRLKVPGRRIYGARKFLLRTGLWRLQTHCSPFIWVLTKTKWWNKMIPLDNFLSKISLQASRFFWPKCNLKFCKMISLLCSSQNLTSRWFLIIIL